MHAKRSATGTTVPVQYNSEIHEPEWSMEDLERHRLMQETRESPAFLTILRYGEFARDFGMDTADLDVMRKVVAAAKKAHNREVEQQAWRESSAALKAVQRGREHPDVVYYMLMGGLVKIGITKNIRQRFDSLHPERVLAVEPGGIALESSRHEQFADLRSHGEWFRLDDRLRTHLNQLQERFEVEVGKPLDQWLRSVGMRIPA